MNNRYKDVFNKIEISQNMEDSLMNMTANNTVRHRRPTKALVAVAIVVAVLLSGMLTANAALDGGIAGWIAGIAYHNDTEEYRNDFLRYDIRHAADSSPYAQDGEGTYEWIQQDGDWYCYINGKPAEGLYLIDGYWYFFGDNGYMFHDCSIPPGTFDSEGHWVYEEPKNSDYDVTPAPVNLNITLEDFCNKPVTQILIRKYVPSEESEDEDSEEHNYYVFGMDYGDDYSDISVEDVYEYYTVYTDDEDTLMSIGAYLLNLQECTKHVAPKVTEDYRIIFDFADGTRDFLSVKEIDGKCYIHTRCGTIYYADMETVEGFYNSME